MHNTLKTINLIIFFSFNFLITISSQAFEYITESSFKSYNSIKEQIDHKNIKHVAFSPDGSKIAMLATYYQSGKPPYDTFQVWDTKSKELLIASNSDYYISAKFSLDGRKITVSSSLYSPFNIIVTSWDLQSGESKTIESINISKNLEQTNKLFINYINNHNINIFDMQNGYLLNTITMHDPDSIYETFTSPDGTKIAVRFRDNTIQIFDVQSGNLLTTLANSYNIEFSPDGTKVAIHFLDNTVQILDAQSAVLLATFDNCAMLKFSSDGKKFAIWLDNEVFIGNALNGELLNRLNNLKLDKSNNNPLSTKFTEITFNPRGTKILIITDPDKQSTGIWDTLSGEPLNLLKDIESTTFSGLTSNRALNTVKDFQSWASFSPDGEKIIVKYAKMGEIYAKVKIFDAQSGDLLTSNYFSAAAFSLDGKTLVAHSNGNLDILLLPPSELFHPTDLTRTIYANLIKEYLANTEQNNVEPNYHNFIYFLQNKDDKTEFYADYIRKMENLNKMRKDYETCINFIKDKYQEEEIYADLIKEIGDIYTTKQDFYVYSLKNSHQHFIDLLKNIYGQDSYSELINVIECLDNIKKKFHQIITALHTGPLKEFDDLEEPVLKSYEDFINYLNKKGDESKKYARTMDYAISVDTAVFNKLDPYTQYYLQVLLERP